MSVFGSIVSGGDVARAATNTLQYWLETYLRQRELETDHEIGWAARPRTWRTVNGFDEKNPEDAPPFIAVISEGLSDQPQKDGGGFFRAPWEIGIGVIVSANGMEAAQYLVQDIYLPTIRRIMLHKQSLSNWEVLSADPPGTLVPFSMGIVWTDESYSPFAADAQRSLAQGQLTFEVWVNEVVTHHGGPTAPANPNTQPGSSWPQVVHVDAEAVIIP